MLVLRSGSQAITAVRAFARGLSNGGSLYRPSRVTSQSSRVLGRIHSVFSSPQIKNPRLYASSDGPHREKASNATAPQRHGHPKRRNRSSPKTPLVNDDESSERPSSPRQEILDRFDRDASATDDERSAQRRALLATLDWLEGVVVGYNLCPFAEAPMIKSELRVEVVLGSNATEILAAVLGESLRLGRDGASGTALVVCPDLCPHQFLGFLEVYTVLVEGILPDHGLDGTIQIAPFHPCFVFGNGDDDEEDEEEEEEEEEDEIPDHLHEEEEEEEEDETDLGDDDDAIDHYTNRSPHPTFHVLREAEVARAVRALDGKAERVWERNVDLLRAMDDLLHDDRDLLREGYLKGRATPAPASASAEGCPVDHAQTKDYRDDIQQLLRDFRTKTY